MTIEFSDLGKKYGTDWIFRQVSGSFDTGAHAILGNNGSGKSTLMQILAGFITPNEGSVIYRLEGKNIAPEEWPRCLAVCSPMLELFEELLVAELIDFHRQLKPLSMATGDLLREIDLESNAEKQVNKLSSGMKQRLKLALAIFSEVPVIFFDEPCSNLDAKWAAWYGVKAMELAKQKTVVIASNSQKAELAPVHGQTLDLAKMQP